MIFPGESNFFFCSAGIWSDVMTVCPCRILPTVGILGCHAHAEPSATITLGLMASSPGHTTPGLPGEICIENPPGKKHAKL